MVCVDYHYVPQAWRTKLPFFLKCARRSWHKSCAAVVLAVPRAQSVLGGTKMKLRAPLGRVLQFHKSSVVVVVGQVPLHLLAGQTAVGQVDSSSPRSPGTWTLSPFLTARPPGQTGSHYFPSKSLYFSLQAFLNKIKVCSRFLHFRIWQEDRPQSRRFSCVRVAWDPAPEPVRDLELFIVSSSFRECVSLSFILTGQCYTCLQIAYSVRGQVGMLVV